mgnify:CR=1 FL=1
MSVLLIVCMDWTPGYCVLANLVLILGLLEFYQLLEKQGARLAYGSAVIATILLITGTIYLQPLDEKQAWIVSLAILTLFSVWVFFAALWRTGQRSPVETVGGTLAGFLYVAWLGHFMVLLVFGIPQARELRLGGLLFLYLAIVTKFCDMGALLTGMAFGRHKMSPRISPKKTWEGFFGGLALATVSSVACVKLFGFDNLGLISMREACGLGLGLALFAVAGDLAESLLKRGVDTKDSGSVIPGIGGILDLIDSLLFTAPVLYFYLRFLSPLLP